jgi:hypothetical protein
VKPRLNDARMSVEDSVAAADEVADEEVSTTVAAATTSAETSRITVTAAILTAEDAEAGIFLGAVGTMVTRVATVVRLQTMHNHRSPIRGLHLVALALSPHLHQAGFHQRLLADGRVTQDMALHSSPHSGLLGWTTHRLSTVGPHLARLGIMARWETRGIIVQQMRSSAVVADRVEEGTVDNSATTTHTAIGPLGTIEVVGAVVVADSVAATEEAEAAETSTVMITANHQLL